MAQDVTVAPSTGEALLFVQNGPGASTGYGAVDLRRDRAASHAKREGVFDQTAWQVMQASGGASTTIQVLANVGIARVDGTSSSSQGEYVVAPHNAAALLTIIAAHATLPRLDSVILQVRDSDFDGSGAWDARVRILAGTPTSGATLDNRTGAPALPASCLHLADVHVPALDTTIADAQIRDYRYHAGPDDIGDIKMNGGTVAPSPGWIAANGVTLNRLVHDRLFGVIGASMGAGDGTLTFETQDLLGRFPLGSGGGSAGRTTGAAAVLGGEGGEEKHTLTEAELAAHDHPHPHTHTVPVRNAGTVGGTVIAGGASDGSVRGNVTSSGASTANTSNAGSGTPHNTLPPFQVAGVWYVYTGSVAA